MNLFPCLVTVPVEGVTYQTCRVVSTPMEGTTVWWWDPELHDARPVLLSSEQLVQNAPNSRNYTLTVEGLPAAHVTRSTSCGCGHPMKRWQLPKPVRDGS